MLGLKLIATNYPIIAAQMLNKIENDIIFFDEFIGDDLVQLYSLTKKHLNYNLRKKMLKAILPYITMKANRIIRYGLEQTRSRYKYYEPGDQWDIQMTIEKMLSSGVRFPTYENIVVQERKKKKKVIVVCIDKSLSVMNLIHQIALTAAVLASSLINEKISVIAFDSKASVIKHINQFMPTQQLIKEILDIESSGKTNIEEALNLAFEELSMAYARDKTVILISDLERTLGQDPLPLMKKLPNLNIIFARTARKNPIVEELVKLKNVNFIEMTKDSDLVSLITKVLSFNS